MPDVLFFEGVQVDMVMVRCVHLFFALLVLSSSLSAQQIVAHRGASEDAPENTMAAFDLAWEQESDAVEGDFYLTADGAIVAVHDKDTKRTGDRTLDVRKSSLAELKTVDAGSWKDQRFAGEQIPIIEEVVASIPDDKVFVLEIKDSPRLVPVLAKKIAENPDFKKLLPNRLMIIAFDANVVRACRQQIPEARAVWLTSFKVDLAVGKVTPTIDSILDTLQQIDAHGLDCKASDHINAAFVRRLREARPDRPYEFHVWTVDDAAVAKRFQKLGVDSITTNRPARLRSSL